MKLRDALDALDAIAPLRLAEPWDNVGLLAGDPAQPVAAALLCIDYTPEVAREARDLGCDLVVAYHPPIFEAIKRVIAPSPIYEAIRDGIALYAPHTALDVAAGGTNDLLADVLGLVERAPLKQAAGALGGAAPGPAQAPVGIGRIGRIAPPEPLAVVLARVKRGLGLASLLVAAPEGRHDASPIATAAACAGACGALIDDAIAQGAELYLTGELRHHDALRAVRSGLTVVCTLHSNSERAALGRLKERLSERLPGLRVILSATDRDPFVIR